MTVCRCTFNSQTGPGDINDRDRLQLLETCGHRDNSVFHRTSFPLDTSGRWWLIIVETITLRTCLRSPTRQMLSSFPVLERKG
jgi:hypothetical protein